MKNYLLICLTVGLMAACGDRQTSKNAPLLKPEDVKRVVLVGGSLVSNMENYGHFERAMLQYYSPAEISFRNIGWPADDVFGLARSQFGSAQNTQSWQPPTAEEGFGSRILMEHIENAKPTTLIIGYGGEAAFSESEEDFGIFKSGYQTLLDFAEQLPRPGGGKIKLVLLSPPRHEAPAVAGLSVDVQKRNEWLGKAATFIRQQAEERGHIFIDLYEALVEDPASRNYTDNSLQLNDKGAEKLKDLLLAGLNIGVATDFTVRLDEEVSVTEAENCQTGDWSKTVRGASFTLTPDKMLYSGEIISKGPVAVYVNGRLTANSLDTVSTVNLWLDSLEEERLMAVIKEKNMLHRYRLRPLNEAYIYLFRRHEMGHLAYEMDDLEKLVEEKEREIARLLESQTYFVEIETVRPWSPPKNYPEDEVPAFIPEPNIEEEIAAFHLPDGYEISLFAADPMIANPISINWDTKGRMWVATSSTYPHIVPGREPNDKIVILEDTNNDGKADKHTVFAEDLLVPHSVMPVPGGAYVTATTEFLYFADTDGDDVADVRRVVYDGFGNADVHHMVHGLRWAPWGDLHFTQSIYINTFIETPYGRRILNGTGTWAFRPETERLEVFSRGLINPWGEAFDQWGQSFATDGAGSSGINYIFPGSAHATAVGASKVLRGLNSGTPKNTAAEVIYSRHFPQAWQGSIITHDFRANRTVRYEIVPKGSGYAAREVETVLRSDHRSYRPVDGKIGPDGALYIVDWYNPIIDHGEVDFHHPLRDKTHGRIWKLTRKNSPLLKVPDFQKATEEELLELLKSPEQITRTLANRAYVERKGSAQKVVDWIASIPRSGRDFNRNRLEGLWLLAALDHYDGPTLAASLSSGHPQERAGAVRMMAHWGSQTDQAPLLEKLVSDPHPQVRLEALHALRQMGDARQTTYQGELAIGAKGLQSAELAIRVLDQPMDENLEFTLDLTLGQLKGAWLPALAKGEEVFGGDRKKQLYALAATEDPAVVGPLGRLLEGPGIDEDLERKAWFLLAKIGDAKTRAKVLSKAVQEQDAPLLRALVNAPVAYDAVPENTDLLEKLFNQEKPAFRTAALQLAARWKTEQYISTINEIAQGAEDVREKAGGFRALAALEKTEEVQKAATSATDVAVRTAATVVWTETDANGAAANAVDLLSGQIPLELAEMVFLTFRRMEHGPTALAGALKGKTLSEETANAGIAVAQTSGLNLTELEAAIREAGNISAVGTQMSREEKDQLIKDALESGNRYRGQAIYRRKELLCATCHRIGNAGGLSGPELTTIGSFMTPNSILESVLNPGSDIKQNYETVLLTKKNGEVISGLLHRKTNNSTLIRQANGDLVEVPAEEIAGTDVSPVSLMPAGLTGNLSRDELKDLMAFLISLGVE